LEEGMSEITRPPRSASAKRRSYAVASSLILLALPAAAATEWPGFRGPAHGGPALAGALPADQLGLEVAWQKTLGSGYSSIAIKNGRAVTLFTSGADDVLAAFDLKTGAEAWRLKLDEKYGGHDGSDDGPISTPAIDGGTVYALGPRGALIAADLASGREIWRHQLDESNASVPFYGFTASPLIAGDLLILPTGGKGHAVTAFDKVKGKVRWTREDDSVAYQSAFATQLAGREQVVAVTDQWLLGLDAGDGKVLWKQQLAEGNVREESAHATPAGKDRLLVDLNGNSKMYQIEAAAGGFAAKELWQSQAFANTLALPVYQDGHLYGFTGRFLTAVDAADGKIKWRSRPPGGQNLSLIDGALAVVDAEGNLVIAAADPREYRELARVKALDRGDYAAAAFAEDTFVVRNLSQIAAVRTVRGRATPAVAAAAPAPEAKGAFGRFLVQVEAAPKAKRQAMVDDYFKNVPAGPVIEADGTVHIVYRGAAKDVGVAGGIVPPDLPDAALRHLDGTDLFYHAVSLDPAGTFEYALAIDYTDPAPDPANAVQFSDGFQAFSVLRLPGSPSVAHLDAPAADAPKGELLNLDFKSEVLSNTRRVGIYLPNGYGAAEGKFPLLVVNHGDRALRAGLYVNSLDNLIAQGKMAPVVAVFVPRGAGPEYAGPQNTNYVRFLTEELLPFVDRHYKTDPGQRALIGVGSAGVASAYAWTKAPKEFGKVAIQSFYLSNEAFREEFFKELAERPAGGQAFVEWSRQDYDIARAQIDAKADSKLLIAKLKERGIDVQEIESAGSANWSRWRTYTGVLLPRLFPPKI
jgi:enterochelin esterase-like enzyme/outer membrane protein assembly factor BamB